MKLQSFLDEKGVAYRLSRHDTAFTASGLAQAEHVPGRKVIKPVVVQADGQFFMCALPASHKVDFEELKRQLEASYVSLVNEEQLGELFPDCELGAAPPIGRLYGMTTLMDESLMRDDRVTFQAGTHEDSITMTLADYRRVAQPEVAYFGRHL
jgi:Ala-tRNA(Pro) deacylase